MVNTDNFLIRRATDVILTSVGAQLLFDYVSIDTTSLHTDVVPAVHVVLRYMSVDKIHVTGPNSVAVGDILSALGWYSSDGKCYTYELGDTTSVADDIALDTVIDYFKPTRCSCIDPTI